MELSWSGPASGDYDGFGLQWTPPDRLSVTRTLLTGRVLGGMFPGRRYNFTVVTIGGGGAKGGATVQSQPIQRSVRTSGWRNLFPLLVSSPLSLFPFFYPCVLSSCFLSSHEGHYTTKDS